jgi:hypothetical protein
MTRTTSDERQPSLRALLESAVRTLEAVLIPELGTSHARATATLLAGQLRYALAQEGADSLASQDDAIRCCIDALVEEHPELRAVVVDSVVDSVSGSVADSGAGRVAGSGAEEAPPDSAGGPSWDLRARAGRLLVHALGREGPAADAIRAQLRSLLVGQIGADLAETAPLFTAFLAAGSLGTHD